MNKRFNYSVQVRERAVRMVLTGEHEHSSRWSATKSVASKIGCTPETLRGLIQKSEVDSGTKPGMITYESTTCCLEFLQEKLTITTH